MDLFKKRKQKKHNEQKSLKNPKILDLNLIKEETSLDFNWRKNIFSLIFILGVVIFVVLEIYLGLNWWQKDEEARLEVAKAEMKILNQEVSKTREEAKDALAYIEKTKIISPLLENHIYWTNFFSWLEKNTLSTISFEAFDASLNEEFALSGEAGSYAEVSWQVKQLQDSEYVTRVEILDASLGEVPATREELEALAAAGESIISTEPEIPGVSFTLNLEMNQNIFKK